MVFLFGSFLGGRALGFVRVDCLVCFSLFLLGCGAFDGGFSFVGLTS